MALGNTHEHPDRKFGAARRVMVTVHFAALTTWADALVFLTVIKTGVAASVQRSLANIEAAIHNIEKKR